MKPLVILILAVCCFASTNVNADNCNTTLEPLVDLLNLYSEATGTKFVIDPRVQATVNLVGIDTSTLDAETLIGILNIHGFTALTSKGVVYVMPDVRANEAGDKFGVRWEG
jgi:type II secretory pathway component GspD/PulD (secretin)